ncbi:MAG TPA: 5-oxoprolinase subunit PxpA [Burkholderiales bacterium]|nr:5-oxoprolinase subunit PxpA [Burkholderiales bacterium]
MAKQINLNADIAESWGAYSIGNDAALVKIIRSASVACGFHAGDPTVMHRFVTLAKEAGCSVGAHPAFNDLWGFGRRRITMRPSDLEYMIAYQIGALQAICAYAGLKVTHLKPHGALNNMAAEDFEYALAIGRAIQAVDRKIIYIVLPGTQMEAAARKLELPLAREGFADRQYDDSGNLASRSIPGTVLKDPAKAVEQVLRMVGDGEIVSRNGKMLKVEIETICVHGDEPTAVDVAGAVRKSLEGAGVQVLPLDEMKLAG